MTKCDCVGTTPPRFHHIQRLNFEFEVKIRKSGSVGSVHAGVHKNMMMKSITIGLGDLDS